MFSTHCQKAFARHRSYILFGRKICDDYVFNRSIRLPQKWYCSCGYGSKEGNKLGMLTCLGVINFFLSVAYILQRVFTHTLGYFCDAY